jgi:hypothetical protein
MRRGGGAPGRRVAADGKGRRTGSMERDGGSDFEFGRSEAGADICVGKGARPKFLAIERTYFIFF